MAWYTFATSGQVMEWFPFSQTRHIMSKTSN